MSLKKEIENTLQKIDIQESRKKVWGKWDKYLFASKIEKIEELTSLQIGFLVILSQKYDELIFPLIESKIEPELLEYQYHEPNSNNEIYIQCIDISNIENGKWEIVYGSNASSVSIFLIMKGWEFKYLDFAH